MNTIAISLGKTAPPRRARPSIAAAVWVLGTLAATSSAQVSVDWNSTDPVLQLRQHLAERPPAVVILSGKPDSEQLRTSKRSNRRRLTPGEIEMLKPIFRDGIDYSKVYIYPETWNIFQPNNVIMAPNGNIYWPLGAGYNGDFSSSGTRGHLDLVHEMTHVYQYQQGISVIGRRLEEGGIYAYVLDPKKTMNDYTLEQQAVMVATYFYCVQNGNVDDCRRRFSPTMAGFFEDAGWLGKDEVRRLQLQEQELNSSS
ncbi:MAG: hypothetical protein AAB320_04300 [Elusimicrobiota bacterium]